MAVCPACGVEVPAGSTDCPSCHLSAGLFDAVREAAGTSGSADPAFVQTVADLLRSVDLEGTPEPMPAPLLRPSAVGKGPTVLDLPKLAPAKVPEPLAPLPGLPPLPPPSRGEPLRQRAREYLRLGRRLGLDLTSIAARVQAAEASEDDRTLEAASRELFVNLASALTVEFEEELARRNEIGQLVPTPSADVELEAIRGALDGGDIVGADRRLGHVRDELARLEELWATGRILIASCDLLAETIVELGGDPGPALGPAREGRRELVDGKREVGERLLARGAIALWAVLETRFFDELKRLRDRLLELRHGGADVGPALIDLRAVSGELRRRNFVGTIVAYRSLRAFAGTPEGGETTAPVAPESGPEPPSPSA